MVFHKISLVQLNADTNLYRSANTHFCSTTSNNIMDNFLIRSSITTVDGNDDSKKRKAVGSEMDKTTSNSRNKKSPKGSKIKGKTIEQHRRAMGDAVKAQISVEKWCIKAKNHCVIEDVDASVFEQLVVVNAENVVPSWKNIDR